MENITADICVIGGGPAGYVAAITAAQHGTKVILIEKDKLGGTCLNRGCIPTKAFLKTAEALSLFSHAKELGILADGVSAPDMKPIKARKEKIVKMLRMGIDSLMKKHAITVITAQASIKAPGVVTAKYDDGETLVNCGKIIVTSGSETLLPPIEGIENDGVLTSTGVLELDTLPESIVIIGSGAIGMEFAEFFCAMGTKVTVVEMKDKILPEIDTDMTDTLMKIMKRRGVKFLTGAAVKKIGKAEDGLLISVEKDGETTDLQAHSVLVAVGRRLNGCAEDIVSAGIKAERGAIAVDENMKTSVDGIYAAGDVIGNKLLAHLAFSEGRAAAESALGIESKVDYGAVPACVYTSPEIAVVGLSEDEAAKKGITVKTGRFDFRANGRALCHGEREGFVKVITDESGRLLGAGIIGYNASEMLGELTLGIRLGLNAADIADTIHPHPSLCEAVEEACADALGRAVHK